jgi:hypothetical protein
MVAGVVLRPELALSLLLIACTPEPDMRFKATALGNTVEFRGDLVAGAPQGSQPIDVGVRLLDVDLTQVNREQQYVGGSWVLVLSSEVIEHNEEFGVEVVPIVARVHMGAGGAAHSIEVNAFPGQVIQLPVAVVNVSLHWDKMPPQNTTVTQRYKVPIRTRVRGTLQRGFSASMGERSYLGEIDTTGNPLTFEGPVPPFAKTLGAYGVRGSNLWVAGTTFSLIEAGGQHLLDLTGLELATIMRDGRRIAVPGTASVWRVQNLAAGFEGGLFAAVSARPTARMGYRSAQWLGGRCTHRCHRA